jgi:hypothetical protein
LAEGSRASLFYAALELRFGIEARLQQYLETQREVSRKKKKGWRVAVMAKNIEKIFQTGDTIVQISFWDQAEAKFEPFSVYYTPVSSQLRKNAERLGNYLHATGHRRTEEKEWWDNLEILL